MAHYLRISNGFDRFRKGGKRTKTRKKNHSLSRRNFSFILDERLFPSPKQKVLLDLAITR